ncbi:MAG TPA: hypothetical protein GX396_05310 [Tissierellia bacterium]|jgi:hypothetical protein|nr:hypothetical protein [Tissierellia bacterium]
MFKKNKVEEDLEKIRRANLPKEKFEDDEINSEDIKLEKGDLLAMILAILSLILPYIIAFIGIMGAVIYIMYLFFR